MKTDSVSSLIQLKFKNILTIEDIQKYLKRIKFNKPPNTDFDTLKGLHQAHILNIPFENLDIHLKKEISTDSAKLFDKIVNTKRGGFCYELNGLFNELLLSLGFKTTIASARVFSTPDKYGEKFDHLCIIVSIGNEKWLADVGFGEFIIFPLKFQPNIEQHDINGTFRIEKFDEYYFVIQKKDGNSWSNLYLLSEKPRDISEFAGMCSYHQNSPDSHFTKQRLCSIATETGRITLTDKVLKIRNGNETTETEITDEKDFNSILKKYFDIEL